MIRYRSARAAFAGAVVVVLAGCASASTSGAAANGTPAAGTSASATSSATPNPAATASGATASATSDQVVPAGAIRFPIAIGNTWVYETIASINNAHAVVTKRVLSVAPVPGGHQVTMSATVNPGRSQSTTQEYYLFYADGQIGFPVHEPHGVSVVSSNGVRWPDAADLASGRAFHSVLNTRLSDGRYETADVTVQGGGTASVTVPAGTYQASLVTMTMVMQLGNFTSTAVVKVWTAPEAGPVKSEQFITAAGKTTLTTTEALLSFTKGAGGAVGS
jgi:hypothetical protein